MICMKTSSYSEPAACSRLPIGSSSREKPYLGWNYLVNRDVA